MRAFGYIRVSTAEQAANGHSIGQQVDRIRAWCAARELELVDCLVDAGVSAGKLLHKRPAGADLVKRMAAGQGDVVVVVAIDRIFRDAQDGLNTMLGIDGQRGLPVQSVSEPVDTTSAMGRFILTVWLARAQLEREQTCERTLAISRGLRAAGKPNGSTPYGCRVVDGRLYRDPVTWPVREEIVRLRRDGGMTTTKIASTLSQRGIASPTGKPAWEQKTVWRIVNSHDGLNHIPALPAGHETAVSTAPEAAQSEGTP